MIYVSFLLNTYNVLSDLSLVWFVFRGKEGESGVRGVRVWEGVWDNGRGEKGRG